MATDWQRFTTRDPPFSIDFPATWNVTENGDDFQLEAPDDDLALTVTRFSSPDGEITPASIQLILDTFAEPRAFRAQPQWLSSEAWNGVEAELGPAADEQEGSLWLFRAVCRGNRAYVMTVTGPRETVERNRETCLEVMSSLRLTAEE